MKYKVFKMVWSDQGNIVFPFDEAIERFKEGKNIKIVSFKWDGYSAGADIFFLGLLDYQEKQSKWEKIVKFIQKILPKIKKQ